MKAFDDLLTAINAELERLRQLWAQALDGQVTANWEELQAKFKGLKKFQVKVANLRDEAVGVLSDLPARRGRKPGRPAGVGKTPGINGRRSSYRRATSFPAGTRFRAAYKNEELEVVVGEDRLLWLKGLAYRSMREVAKYLGDGVPIYLANLGNWTVVEPEGAEAPAAESFAEGAPQAEATEALAAGKPSGAKRGRPRKIHLVDEGESASATEPEPEPATED